MKRDQVDILLQLAYLEGKIKTRGAYERSVLRKTPAIEAAAESRNRLQARLEAALAAKTVSVEVPATIGLFLRNVRLERSIRPEEIFTRVGFSRNIYRMLEQDRISPLRIPVPAWKKFGRLFNLSSDVLVEMVRRTHQLVFFRPAFRTTLARYDARRNRTLKAATLEKAAQELYTRATLALPPEEEKKLNALLDSIAE